MSENNALILQLDNGVNALIEKVTKLTLIVKNQEDKISTLENEIAQYESTKVEMESEISRLKSQSLESDKQIINEYKVKINELVKEIDNCISLLNG